MILVFLMFDKIGLTYAYIKLLTNIMSPLFKWGKDGYNTDKWKWKNDVYGCFI